MSTIMTASNQWASRPDDQRFVDLPSMLDHFQAIRANSRAVVVPSRRLEALPLDDNKGLVLRGPNGHDYAPTHWSFGQLAQLAEAPAGYLRTLPSPMAADCINFGLQCKRDIEDVGVLLYKNGGDPIARAVTGPKYGRVWNSDVVGALVNRFGDGVSGHFRVPGEFGKAVDVTKANTTLYASDRDMFVFLADENNRIEIPNRRDGEAGTMARGFFVWNSEEGDKTLGIATFLFDYVCCNRIVWGAAEYKEIRVRHTISAPDKFIAEVAPALENYAQSSTRGIEQAIANARATKIETDVSEFLAKRFGKRVVQSIITAHELDEGRPIETIWDATTAVTAYARSITHTDRRVDLERQAGDLMAMAS
jgi:hypothetical protein